MAAVPSQTPTLSQGDNDSGSSDSSDWDQDQAGDLDEGDDNDDEVEEIQVVSLVDDKVFADWRAMLEHCKAIKDFDFLAVRGRLRLDFYGCVKLVNKVRRMVKDGQAPSNDISASDLEDDSLLMPVLDDDAFITCIDEFPELSDEAAATAESNREQGVSAVDASAELKAYKKKAAELEEQLRTTTAQFDNYRLAVEKTLDERWGEDSPKAAVAEEPKKSGVADEDDGMYYFDGYGHNDIHETMLKDTVRTDAYRDFIYLNKHLFKDKVVLDIGCGSGILSMFCAKAGASKVIAVDNATIIEKARLNVFNNGLDGIITLVRGKIEDVTLPVRHVDVIVSEWMGYCLLYENMLASILFARDRYLAPGGILAPSHVSLWMAALADPAWVADKADFWDSVYGFDMTAMAAVRRRHRRAGDKGDKGSVPGAYDGNKEGDAAAAADGEDDEQHPEVRIESMDKESVVKPAICFRTLDLYTVGVEDLQFTTSFELAASAPDEANPDPVQGYVVWFDTFFAASRNPGENPGPTDAAAWAKSGTESSGGTRIAFTTGVSGTVTHWAQGVLVYDKKDRQTPVATDGKVQGTVSFTVPKSNPRGLSITVDVARSEGKEGLKRTWTIA